MVKVIVSFFLLGLSFGAGPCLASCGPMLISYVAGTKKNIPQGLLIYILFSLSRIFVYLLLSLLVFFLGVHTLGRLSEGLSKSIFIFGGTFIVVIGLLMAAGKSLKFSLWQSLERKLLERDKKSIIVLGLAVGLLPCAPLLAVLSYIGLVSKAWPQSLAYGLSFGAGTLLSPLILLVISAGLIPRIFKDKKAAYYRVFSFICGIIIIFLGAQLLRRGFNA